MPLLWPAVDETTFRDKHVIPMAKALGYEVYFTWSSRNSPEGFLDLVLARESPPRLLFRELKTEKGRVTDGQKKWLRVLTAMGEDAKVWRPADWLDGTIERELRGG